MQIIKTTNGFNAARIQVGLQLLAQQYGVSDESLTDRIINKHMKHAADSSWQLEANPPLADELSSVACFRRLLVSRALGSQE